MTKVLNPYSDRFMSSHYEALEDSGCSYIVKSDLHGFLENRKQLSDILEENDNDPPVACCSVVFKQEIYMNLRLGFPLMVTNILQFCLVLETTAFAGRMSAIELEGTGLAISLIQAFGWFILGGMVSACDTMMSQTYGSDNKKRTGLFLQRGLLMMNILPMVLWCIHINFEPLLILLKQNPDVAQVTADFAIHFIPGLTFMLNYLLLARYMQNQNHTKIPVVAGICGNIFNIIFQSIFVLYLKFGYRAGAISLNLSYLLMMLIEIFYIKYSKFYLPTWPGFQWEAFYDWKQMFKLGMAGIAHTSFECFVWESTVFLGGLLGTTQLATNSILIQIVNFMFLVYFGAGCASNIRVGQCLGSNRPNQAKASYRAGLLVIGIITAILATLCAGLHRYVGYIFTNQEDVVKMIGDTFPYLFVVIYSDPFSGVCIGSIRGCGRQGIGAFVMFIAFYIFALPTSIILAFIYKWDVKGLWIGVTVGSFVSVISNLSILECQNWTKRAQEAQKRITYTSIKNNVDVIADNEVSVLLPNHEIEVESDSFNANYTLTQPSSKIYHVRTPSNPIFCSTDIVHIPPPRPSLFSWKILIKRLLTYVAFFLLLIIASLVHIYLDPSLYRPNSTNAKNSTISNN